MTSQNTPTSAADQDEAVDEEGRVGGEAEAAVDDVLEVGDVVSVATCAVLRRIGWSRELLLKRRSSQFKPVQTNHMTNLVLKCTNRVGEASWLAVEEQPKATRAASRADQPR